MRLLLWPAVTLSATLAAQTLAEVQQWLDRPVLASHQTMLETQVYTASKVIPMPVFATADAWRRYAEQLRRQILDEIVFRGEARNWRQAPRKVEFLDSMAGEGYRLRKLRFEAVPGLWIPALLYEPAQLAGRVPAVLNVNGHERTGISTPYIQTRCINLARRGMLAFNAEWIGRGQLIADGNDHGRMPQIDLTGTSGLAVFYLQMERALDILLEHPHADPARVAVTGLSGGGWQTTLISALDPRVKLAVPVAGHSSYVTRAQWPQFDLGDSEQTPSDLASRADYLHLTAMMAPRPLMLINNANDTCCFRADYALGPLVQAARQVYALYGALDRLRYFINHGPGHNYDQSSREELYRFLKAEFFSAASALPHEEFPVEKEIRTAEQLYVPAPANNATLHSLAMSLSNNLPKPGGATRDRLEQIVKPAAMSVDARLRGRQSVAQGQVSWWELKMGGAWSVPAVELEPVNVDRAVILVGDRGRQALAARALALFQQGARVLAVDLWYFGECRIPSRDFLFALLMAGVGDRPLGLQAGQLRSAARWFSQRTSRPAGIEAHGRRTSLAALIAAALEPQTIAKADLRGSLRSLREVITADVTVQQAPELFCFGLLESFDIPQIAALATSVAMQDE